jgi:DNA repair protein RadD
VCPECQELNPLNASACACCGFEWPKPAPKPRHATFADATPVLSTGQSWLPVTRTSFFVHHKRSDPSAPPTMRVSYLTGLVTPYDEYICFEHAGYARARAEKWWFAFGGMAPAPATVMEAVMRSNELGRAVEIAVYRNDRFWNVSDRRVARRDGAAVEIDRHLNSWVAKSREAAFDNFKSEPIGDEVPF